MSISYEDVLNLALPADGDESWGNATRQNAMVLGLLASPQNAYFVSPTFTDANLHNAGASDRRHFATLQEAHDAIPTGAGTSYQPTIYVFPGSFGENIAITKSCTIHGVSRVWSRNLGGLRGARLTGVAAVQSPTITITPTESAALSVAFVNLTISNAYNVAAGAIDKGYALSIAPQTLYGSTPNYVAFVGCDFRMQTYGVGNQWAAGFLMNGYNSVEFIDCTISGMSYAGGSYNGGIHNMFYAIGRYADSKACAFRVLNSRIQQYYAGAILTSPNVFFLDQSANAVVAGTSIWKESAIGYYSLGGTGTNAISGLTEGSPAGSTYNNMLGIDLAAL